MTASPPSSVSLATVVQHHPKRARLLGSLLPALGECDVISDPEPDAKPSAIRTYIACLRALPAWASHLLIVQDDARPCTGFAGKAQAAVEQHPEDLVALFLAGAPARSARLAKQTHARGDSWTLMAAQDWTPTVALVWPRDISEMFLNFLAERPQLVRVGDDNAVGEFTRRASLPVWATVPSLVEHPDVEPSLIGRRAGAGRNRLRAAAVPPLS